MKDNDWIFEVVNSFYQKVQDDVLIGYHFRIIHDFNEHIPRIASFWDMQLLGSTERAVAEPFDVIKVHVPLGIKRGELARWLVLFRKTLDDEVKKHPDKIHLSHLWEKKLVIFEKIFLRFFGL